MSTSRDRTHRRRRGAAARVALGLAGAGAATALAALPAAAGAAVPTIERVSVATDGTQSNSFPPLIHGGTTVSDDGRYAAWVSFADTLVPNDPAWADVFVRDRVLGTTERVSGPPGGGESDGNVLSAEISRDGRYALFVSEAANLVGDDTNGAADTFLHDRSTGRTERVSVGDRGQQANGRSPEIVVSRGISDDGRYVAFLTGADNLVPGAFSHGWDLLVRDRVAGTTRRALALPDGRAVTVASQAAMSADAGTFAFDSRDPLLTGAPTERGVYAHHAATGETERVDVLAGPPATTGGTTRNPRISADGRVVVIETPDPLVAEDTNGVMDVYARDLAADTTARVSVADDGSQVAGPNGSGRSGDVDAVGRYVTFHAAGFPGQDSAGHRRDLIAGRTERISFNAAGAPVSWVPFSLTGDGQHIGFRSSRSDLVTGDTNGLSDEFVADLAPIEPPGDPYADALAAGNSARVTDGDASLGAPDGRAATVAGTLNRSVTWLMDDAGTGDLTLHLAGGSSLALGPTVQLLDADGAVIASRSVATFASSGRRSLVVPYAGSAAYSGIRIRTGLYTRIHVDAIEAEELAG